MSEDKSKLQLIGEIAQANNKSLELIEELNDREEEIERLNNNINELEKYVIKQMKKYEGYDKDFEIVLSNIMVILGSDK